MNKYYINNKIYIIKTIKIKIIQLANIILFDEIIYTILILNTIYNKKKYTEYI